MNEQELENEMRLGIAKMLANSFQKCQTGTVCKALNLDSSLLTSWLEKNKDKLEWEIAQGGMMVIFPSTPVNNPQPSRGLDTLPADTTSRLMSTLMQ